MGEGLVMGLHLGKGICSHLGTGGVEVCNGLGTGLAEQFARLGQLKGSSHFGTLGAMH